MLGAPLLIDASSLSTNELIGAASEREAPRVEAVAKEMCAIATSLVMDQRHQADRRRHVAGGREALKGKSSAAVAWRSAFAFASPGLRVVLIDVYGSRPPARDWWNRVAMISRGRNGPTAGSRWAARSGVYSGWLLAGPPGTRPTVFTRPPQLGLYFCGEPPPVRSQRDLTDVLLDLENNFDVVLVVAPPFLALATPRTSRRQPGDHGRRARRWECHRSRANHRRIRISGSALVGYVYYTGTERQRLVRAEANHRAALPEKTTQRAS